jgi:hypothetical protein
VLTIRGRGRRLWCQQCGCEVRVVPAETLMGLGQLRLSNGVEPRQWHSFEELDGTPVVCLKSLLKST